MKSVTDRSRTGALVLPLSHKAFSITHVQAYMPGRKASADSDLAVEWVLAGNGKASQAASKFPNAGSIRNIQKRVKRVSYR